MTPLMVQKRLSPLRWALAIFTLVFIVSGCAIGPGGNSTETIAIKTPDQTPSPPPTPLPTRPIYSPGELVDYIAQSGDTLPALAGHFNTTVEEIRSANSILPQDVSTLPIGLPLKVPIYYQPFWGSAFQILPDDAFVNGPSQIGFNIQEFMQNLPGWLNNYHEYAAGEVRDGSSIVEYISTYYSISPRLLLALIEYQSKGLSQSGTGPSSEYPLGIENKFYRSFYQQMILAANALNDGFYGWRTGRTRSFDHVDGTVEYPDPWQNAATVGLQLFFARTLDLPNYQIAIHGEGFLKTYKGLFGDPWESSVSQIPGSLHQPAMLLPFPVTSTWVLTGGPHTGWGSGGNPWAALDFAPPLVAGGCQEADQFATAVADGVIARVGTAVVVLDLDGDGDERTGWTVLYLHVKSVDLPLLGTQLRSGDLIGRPSCEGGTATGTHVHIARKFNGEWIAADSAIPFDLEGWIAHNGNSAYLGTLTRAGHAVNACVCSSSASQLTAGK